MYAEFTAFAQNCNFGDQFDSQVKEQLSMAVEHEIYFPNSVAENIALLNMTFAKSLERILNIEKAIACERSEVIEWWTEKKH